MTKTLIHEKQLSSTWFRELRDAICAAFELIEVEYAALHDVTPGKFKYTPWERKEGGGGVMAVMKGNVFEKVGVNISTVYGDFEPAFAKSIPGAEHDPSFWASGISLVSHMCNPHVPATHMNTRFLATQKWWFGGGADMTPYTLNKAEDKAFHDGFREACDAHDPAYYPKFKKWCDEYFYLPHRGESRGIGGIFFDYVNTGHWEKDFYFTQDVGRAFLKTYPEIVRRTMNLPWTEAEREKQLEKRGRYVEFNLLYDRGTLFGLKTGGNVEAILMSMPPEVKWG